MFGFFDGAQDLRYDSKYENLEQRDREINKNSRDFRRSLFDYDVEQAALAHRNQS